MSSYDKFKQLLDEHHVKPCNVSKATGVASATLSEWKHGRYTPKLSKLMLIAKFFDVPIDYFLSEEVPE